MHLDKGFTRVAGLLLAVVLGGPLSSSAQITLLDSFDPVEPGELCSIAVDPLEGEIFVYGCFNDNIHRFSPDGTLLGTTLRPGESANDVDLHIAPEDLSLGGVSVPRGTLLFINGESGVAEIYAVEPETGEVLETLVTDFGNGSVVGGAYSPFRDAFFLVNYTDDVIGEIDPSTGTTLNTFDVTEHVDVFYGDVEVSPVTGNLFIVSNIAAGIYEFTPEGTFEGSFPVPDGVGNPTGIGLDCERNEAWVSERSGFMRRLGEVPCGSTPVVDDSCVLIDFETVPGETVVEGLTISNQFLNSTGITFSLEGGGAPLLAEVGSPAVAFESPVGDDTPLSLQEVQSFFLTDDGVLSVNSPPPIIASFRTPVDSASGVVLDLDEETFTIQALGADGQLLEEVVLASGDDGTGDGVVTPWSLDRPAADVFSLRFITTRPSGRIGIGMDNFTSCSPDRDPGGGDQISVTEPDDVEAVSGGDVALQATLPTGFNATVREVCYRRTGESEYTCTQLQPGGNGYQGAIPSSFVTARGIQYYYRFSDGTTEVTVPDTDPENSAFDLPVRVNGLRAGGSFSPGTYRMLTIPVDLSDGSFTNVLDEYGPVDTRRWRLLRWEPTLETYREYPDLAGGFSPCEAYWLITFDGGDFEIEDGESVNPVEPCSAVVRPGWNQLGSPYAFPIAWSDVEFNGTLDGPVLYDASSDDSGGVADPYVYDVQILEPWQGYWVFNPGTQDVFLSFRPIEATASPGKNSAKRHLAGDDFELRLRATMPESNLVDSENYVGLTPLASVGFDDTDFAEAPPVGDHVRLSIVEEDMRLAGSFRPAGDGQAWDLRMDGRIDGDPAGGIVRVTLDEFGRRPDGFGLRVVDLDNAQPVRLDDDGFEIELTPSRPVRNLRLIVGTETFSDEAGDSVPEVPQSADLAQNYPNPFNPSTRIRYQVHVDGLVEIAVFDPLGRRIRTLVDERREPGWYETVWNGRDSSGAQTSSGLYFYVLKTTDGSLARTMVLLR